MEKTGVRMSARDEFVRAILLSEMVARTLKMMLNGVFRNTSSERLPLKIPYRDALLDFLNLLIDSPSSKYTQEACKTFWAVELKTKISEKFPKCLFREEFRPSFNLRNAIIHSYLFTRFQQLGAFTLSNKINEDIQSVSHINDLPFRFFSASDILTIGAKVKHINVIDEAEANILFFEASRTVGPQADQLWKLVDNKFSAAIAGDTYNYKTLTKWAQALLQQSRTQINPPTSLALLSNATQKIARAVFISSFY